MPVKIILLNLKPVTDTANATEDFLINKYSNEIKHSCVRNDGIFHVTLIKSSRKAMVELNI